MRSVRNNPDLPITHDAFAGVPYSKAPSPIHTHGWPYDSEYQATEKWLREREQKRQRAGEEPEL
jgi:hypothetical protein